MRLKRTDTISGYPIKAIRDFLRENNSWRERTIANYLEIGDDEAKRLNNDLVARGFATEKLDAQGPIYERTLDGSRVANARLLTPISRARADQLVNELLDRVESVNANPELVETITKVRVFGSYITDSPDVADIDLIIDRRRRKPPNGLDWVGWNTQRARLSGKKMQNYIDEITYGSTEITRLLKARCRFLSFHDPISLDETGAQSKVLWALKS